MAFDDSTGDLPRTFAPTSQPPGPTGPYAPLPPSRRGRDNATQWVVVLAVVVGAIVMAAVVLVARPSKSVTPAPRAPSTSSQQDCGYQYLPCPTTGRPR